MDNLFDKRRTVVPSGMQFPLPANTEGVILAKSVTQFFPADNLTTFKAGDTLRLKIQHQRAVDLPTIALVFDLEMGNQNTSMDDWAGSCFSDLKISFNDGAQIEYIENHNRAHNALSALTSHAGYRQSFYGAMEGYYPKVNPTFGDANMEIKTSATLNTIASNFGASYHPLVTNAIILGTPPSVPTDNKQKGGLLNGIYLLRRFADNADPLTVTRYATRDKRLARQYVMHFDMSGFLGRYAKIFWIPTVNSIDIRLTMAPNKDVCNSWGKDANTLTYSLKNPHLQCEMFTLGQQYIDALTGVLLDSGLTVSFDTFETRRLDIAQGATDQNIRIHARLSSLKSIYFWMYQPNTDTGGQEEAKRIDKTSIQQRYLYNGADKRELESYQIYIDGRPIQAHEIITTDGKHAEAQWELMKSLSIAGDISKSPAVSEDSYIRRGPTTNLTANETLQAFLTEEHFVLGTDFEAVEDLSGIPVSANIRIRLKFSGPSGPGIGTQLFVLMHFDKNVGIFPGLSFEDRT